MDEYRELSPDLKAFYQRQEKAHRLRTSRKKDIRVDDMVKVYRIAGVFRVKVVGIYETSVESVKLYELQDAYKNLSYATIDFIEKV